MGTQRYHIRKPPLAGALHQVVAFAALLQEPSSSLLSFLKKMLASNDEGGDRRQSFLHGAQTACELETMSDFLGFKHHVAKLQGEPFLF